MYKYSRTPRKLLFMLSFLVSWQAHSVLSSYPVNIEKDTRFTILSTIKEMFDVYCKNIIPYMYLYKHLVEYYEKTVYDILKKDIGLILPKFEDREKNIKQRCQKRQIISALISGFIGLAFEGISSFLQHK